MLSFNIKGNVLPRERERERVQYHMHYFGKGTKANKNKCNNGPIAKAVMAEAPRQKAHLKFYYGKVN